MTGKGNRCVERKTRSKGSEDMWWTGGGGQQENRQLGRGSQGFTKTLETQGGKTKALGKL